MQSDQQVDMGLDHPNAKNQCFLLFGNVPDQGAEYVRNGRINQPAPMPGCPDDMDVDAVAHPE